MIRGLSAPRSVALISQARDLPDILDPAPSEPDPAVAAGDARLHK
jgi:hypothetical protein